MLFVPLEILFRGIFLTFFLTNNMRNTKMLAPSANKIFSRMKTGGPLTGSITKNTPSFIGVL